MSDETLVNNELAQSLQMGDFATFNASLSPPTGPTTMSHTQQTAAVFAGLARNARGATLRVPELDIASVAASAAHELTSSSRKPVPTPPRTTPVAQPTTTVPAKLTTMAPPLTTQTPSAIPTPLLQPSPGSYPTTTSASNASTTSGFSSPTLTAFPGFIPPFPGLPYMTNMPPNMASMAPNMNPNMTPNMTNMAMWNMSAQNLMQDHMTLMSQMAAQAAREQIMRHKATPPQTTETPATADGRPAATARPTQPTSPAPGIPNIFPGISMYQDEKRDGELNKWLNSLPRQTYHKRPPLTEWLTEFWVPNGYWEGRDGAGTSFDSTHKVHTLVNKNLEAFKEYPTGMDNRSEQQRRDDEAKEKYEYKSHAQFLQALSRHSVVQWFLRPHDPRWMVYLNFWLDTFANRHRFPIHSRHLKDADEYLRRWMGSLPGTLITSAELRLRLDSWFSYQGPHTVPTLTQSNPRLPLPAGQQPARQPTPSPKRPRLSNTGAAVVEPHNQICRNWNRGYCQEVCSFGRLHLCKTCRSNHREIDHLKTEKAPATTTT